MQLACRRSERYVLLIVSPLSPSIQQSPSQLRRTIYVSAVRHFPKAAIKFPVTVNILFPHCDEPYRFEFVSYKDFSDFLEPQSILRALSPGSKNIRARNIKDLDPTKAYEIVGPGYIYLGQERRPLKDQVWDTSRVFEEKSKLALKVKLQKDHPGLVDLPRVICDKATGKNVAEWEAVFQLSDGSIIFLESKYRMTLSHVDKQAGRMATSLLALGKPVKNSKLYLAGYYWHDDESTLSFAGQKGYGIIRPDGEDLDILEPA